MSGIVLQNLNSRTLQAGDPKPSPVEAGVLRIYSMRFCPWAQRVLIYLAKHGIRSEVVNIHLKKKPEWYFLIHPDGKVPAIEYNGEIVLESSLIPEFLDDVFLDTRILPVNAYGKYRQKLILERLSDISSALNGLMIAANNSAVKVEKYAHLEKFMNTAEALLCDTFFGGDIVGFADYMVFPLFEKIHSATMLGASPLSSNLFPGVEYPKISAWYSTMAKLPEIVGAVQSSEHDCSFVKSVIFGTPEYDTGC